jgi:ATP-dependent Clp protease protease subunit
MNYDNSNIIRFEQEEEPETPATENPIEKMMGGMMFDKKFIEQRKVFLWGEVHDKSARDITNRLL